MQFNPQLEYTAIMDTLPLPRSMKVTITQPVVPADFGKDFTNSLRAAERRAQDQVAAQLGVRPVGASILDCLPRSKKDLTQGTRRLVVEVVLA